MLDCRKEGKALAAIANRLDRGLAVSFSGGKDSLVVLDLAQRVGVQKAVFIDTSIEFDETVEYVNRVSEFFAVKIDVVRPLKTFFEMVKEIGLPSRRFRWCCDVLKFSPLNKYATEHDVGTYVTGLRRSESSRRTFYTEDDNNPVVATPQLNPIIDWLEEDVWNYIKRYNLPCNPLYDRLRRIGCWCCPYKSETEWKLVRELVPEKIEVFEKAALDYAERIGIYDKEAYVSGGWATFAPPVRKRTVGLCESEPCQIPGEDKVDLILSAASEEQALRVSRLLPVITEDYLLVGKRLRVTIDEGKRTRANILIEKAINCIGCGACIGICPTGALQLENGSIRVEGARCIQCEKCLNTRILRGSCIMRNYNPRRQALVSIDS